MVNPVATIQLPSRPTGCRDVLESRGGPRIQVFNVKSGDTILISAEYMALSITDSLGLRRSRCFTPDSHPCAGPALRRNDTIRSTDQTSGSNTQIHSSQLHQGCISGGYYAGRPPPRQENSGWEMGGFSWPC